MKQIDLKEFSSLINEKMRTENITNKKLAELTDLSLVTISRIKNSLDTISIKNYNKVLNILRLQTIEIKKVSSEINSIIREKKLKQSDITKNIGLSGVTIASIRNNKNSVSVKNYNLLIEFICL